MNWNFPEYEPDNTNPSTCLAWWNEIDIWPTYRADGLQPPTPTSNIYTGLGCECAKTLQRMCKLEGVVEDAIATKATSGRQIREAPSSHFTLSQEIRQRPKLKKVPLHHWHLIVQSFPDQSCSFFNLISGDLLISGKALLLLLMDLLLLLLVLPAPSLGQSRHNIFQMRLHLRRKCITRPSILCVTHQMSRKKRNYSVGWTVPIEMMN